MTTNNVKFILIAIVSLCITVISAYSQSNNYSKKTIRATKIQSIIKIDGKDDEVAWRSSEIAKDFTQYYPDNLPYEDPDQKTEVRILYDDSGLYIFANMYDKYPDSILSQMTSRDQFGVADVFSVRLNPYNDAQQEFVFSITAAGVQIDQIYTLGNEADESWDAIWSSAVSSNASGWKAELKLPYSALRFPKNTENSWSINFERKIQRNRKVFSWVFNDRNVSNSMLFTGDLTGITDISPPTRLFLIPYISAYINKFDGRFGNDLKAGADIKCGISDNFTLDAILIPDFGQTAFDDEEYILGPFEQEFEERRPFFTEGVDLFSKGDLIYTRRIGQVSDFMPELASNDSIIEFPAQTNLINAVKVSGRTSKGLGIGVANAITDKAIARIKDIETSEIRSVIQTPFSNYNIFVLDQRYGDNNSLSFINTSVLRKGDFRNANVSGILSDNYFFNNTWGIKNELKLSYIDKNSVGTWFNSFLGEIKGKHRYNISFRYVSKDYNINDFGFNYYKNYTNYQANYIYSILKSTDVFNSFNFNFYASSRINNVTKKSEFASLNFRINSQNKKNNYFGIGITINPFKTYDHYEPRETGRYMRNFRMAHFWIGYSPNFNKKFLVEFFPTLYFKEEKGMWGYEMVLEPRWRASEKLLILTKIEFGNNFNDYGFVTTKNDDIIIGSRDRFNYEAELSIKYNFNPHISANIALRHYWTAIRYKKYFTLLENGDYDLRTEQQSENDLTYNNWNVDFNINWWFAPGSQLTFLYRNSIENFKETYISSLTDNLDDMFSGPQSNTVSLRITYFLDYNKIKKVF